MYGCECVVFFFKQKTAYEMRISDWSSDVCSSDLEIYEMQARAVFEAASDVAAETGEPVVPEIMVPLVATARELEIIKGVIDAAAEIGRASCRERVCQYG